MPMCSLVMQELGLPQLPDEFIAHAAVRLNPSLLKPRLQFWRSRFGTETAAELLMKHTYLMSSRAEVIERSLGWLQSRIPLPPAGYARLLRFAPRSGNGRLVRCGLAVLLFVAFASRSRHPTRAELRGSRSQSHYLQAKHGEGGESGCGVPCAARDTPMQPGTGSASDLSGAVPADRQPNNAESKNE